MLLGIPINACDKYLNRRKLVTFTLAVLEGKKQHHHPKWSQTNQGFISQEKRNSKVVSKSVGFFCSFVVFFFFLLLWVGFFFVFTNTYYQQLKRGKKWKSGQITKPEQKGRMHLCRYKSEKHNILHFGKRQKKSEVFPQTPAGTVSSSTPFSLCLRAVSLFFTR